MRDELNVWLNGAWLPLRDASLSILDAGVTTGASVTERLRTFRHQPFLLDEHLDRLQASAEAAFVHLREPIESIRSLVAEIVERNAALLNGDDDLSVSVFATNGIAGEPTLCIHAPPIPAGDYATFYETGLSLATPSTVAISPATLSPHIKTRNRLHWHIADHQAEELDPGAKALLVDRDGFVTETSTGNLFIAHGDQLLTPRRIRTLRGISQQFVMKIAVEQGFVVSLTNLRIEDVATADEAFLTSSVYCMLPVVRLNRCGIGDGRPGVTYRRLLAAWSEQVGVDIAAQMSK